MPASTVAEYIAALPEERRTAIAKVREQVNAHLPAGFEEGIQFGMISWHIPLSRYPTTYNKQPLGIAALASQKGHMALYLTTVYADPELEAWFRQAFADAGKRLDMGKSCVRFAKLEDLPLDVIGQTIARVSVEDYIARYEEAKAGATSKSKAQSKSKSKSKAKSMSKSKAQSKSKARPTSKTRPKAKRRPAAKSRR